MVQKFHETHSYINVQRAWRLRFKSKNAPDRKTIMRTVSKFSTMGFVDDLPPFRQKINNEQQVIKNRVKAMFLKDPTLSTRKAANITGTSHMTVHRILTDDLHLNPYKCHNCQELMPTDYVKRLAFARWALSLPIGSHNFFIVSDESIFPLTQAINNQNDRIWSDSRPENSIEVPLHDEKVHVWCGFSSKKIYGPYFFEDTVNGSNYLEMLKSFFWPKVLKTADRHKYYFIQDGAPPHRANIVQNWCTRKFGQKFINNKMWPPRSPDLNPCDFFLWGYLKSAVYNPMPKTIDQLKANIQREIKKITADMLKSTFNNFSKRCELIISVNGGHFEDK
jgi:hypothetical protein